MLDQLKSFHFVSFQICKRMLFFFFSCFQVAEFTKECSEKWKNLNSAQRKPFDEKAAKDKARYEKEVTGKS